jgi:hypothetical protein
MDIVTPAVRRTVKQPAMRWLAAAVLVEAVGLTLLTGALLATRGAQGPQSAAYRTVTSPAAAREGAVIRAVFARTLTVADMQTLLSESRLSIVAGPTEAGVYTLAPTVPTDRTQVARSLARLRASSGVRFAEPIVEPTGDLAPVSADAPR